jgi:hypothetical protein
MFAPYSRFSLQRTEFTNGVIRANVWASCYGASTGAFICCFCVGPVSYSSHLLPLNVLVAPFSPALLGTVESG